VHHRWAALEDVNVDAWEVWGALNSQLVHDWGLVPYTLTALTEGWSGEARADLVARLEVMRQILTPPTDDG